MPTSAMVLRVDDGFLSAGTFYYHGDALGSARMMTDAGGNVAWSGTYLPFGQEWNAEATGNHYKFTGYERDAESNLDYAMARHYTSQYGRFMQPDPAGLAAVDPSNPQSWNRYAYVGNNPLNFVDPSGMSGLPPWTPWCFGSDPVPSWAYWCANAGDPGNGYGGVGVSPPSPFGLGIPYCSPGDSCSDNGGGGGGGGQQQQTGPQPKCAQPNWLNRLEIPVMQHFAMKRHETVGIGLSFSAAVGKIFGVAGGASGYLTVTESGQAFFLFTHSYTSVLEQTAPVQVGPVSGSGVLFGPSLMQSSAQSPGQLSGTSVDAGGSDADGLGVGGDVSFGAGGMTTSVTAGFGAGGSGHALTFQQSSVVPVCGYF